MKRNLMSVIILALTVANLVLTALLLFTVLPETKKANELITKVCTAIDLDLNSGASTGLSNVPFDKIETYAIQGDKGEATMTIGLRSDDGKNHFAMIAVTLALNTESDNYAKYSPEVLTSKQDIIKNNIIQIVGSYTKSEFDADKRGVQDAILADLQGMFGPDYIVDVMFPSCVTQ